MFDSARHCAAVHKNGPGVTDPQIYGTETHHKMIKLASKGALGPGVDGK